jgi:hypothetical protein
VFAIVRTIGIGPFRQGAPQRRPPAGSGHPELVLDGRSEFLRQNCHHHGCGRATALRFARGGANIAGWDVSDKAATTFETDISAAGGQALFKVVNVTDTAAVETAVNKSIEQWGGINNAGIVRDAVLMKKNGGVL